MVPIVTMPPLSTKSTPIAQVPSTPGNGKVVFAMAKEPWSGSIQHVTKVIGSTTRPAEMESSIIPMEISMMALG